ASSSDRATMQLRTSPGGSMLNSLRRRPLEPPSSVTVTIAASSDTFGKLPSESRGSGVFPPLPTYFFNPLSRVERPVPPPIATTRNSRPPGCGIGSTRIPQLLLREEEACLRRDRDTAIQ